MDLAIGIDAGATHLRACLMGSDGAVVGRRRSALPDDMCRLPEVLAAVVDELRGEVEGGRLVGVGVGCAGIIETDSGVLLLSPNAGIRSLDLSRELATLTGLSVTAMNDADAAALAEARMGAGQGLAHFVFLTLGTGIGGSIVIDGQPLLGTRASTAEIGHMCMDPDGPPCACGSRGCLEAYASASAWAKEAAARLAADPGVTSEMRGRKLNGQAVAEAARNGDRLALDVMRRAARYLGVALANIINLIDPALIVIGGGASRAADLYLDIARAEAAARALNKEAVCDIVLSGLGDDAGMYGAALRALEIGR